VGAALDLPADERNVLALVAGAQHFTGGNMRLHLRGNYVHVVKPAWGLSLQLRTRYSHDSDPGQFDYYSPRWYAQVLPVVQLRRFVDRWEIVAAGGLGAQRDAATSWRQSQFAQLRFRSPPNASHWSGFGEFTYTNAPSNSASSNSGYRYFQSTLGVKRRF